MIIFLIVKAVLASMAATTQNEGISYASHNVFVDTSLPPSTAFQRKYEVIFDGNSSLRGDLFKMESMRIPMINNRLWKDNTILSQWTFFMWFKPQDLDSTQTLVNFKIYQEDPAIEISCKLSEKLLSCFDLVSVTLDRIDQWYFMAIDSTGLLRLYDKEFTKKVKSSSTRLSLGNSEVEIGEGFKGAIRHVNLMSRTYSSDTEIRYIAF
jgi:hypothetical protein